MAGTSSCVAGHSGPLCQVCQHERQHFENGFCRDCPKVSHGVAVFLAIMIPVLGFAGLLYILHEHKGPRFAMIAVPLRQLVHHAKTYLTRIGLVPKVKIALIFSQVCASLDYTYSIGLPESWFRWTSIFRFLGALDVVSWFGPTACIVGGGVTRKLLLRALAPLFIIVVVPLLGAFAGCRKLTLSRKQSRGQVALSLMVEWLPASLVVAFCFTPSVSASIFRSWHCVRGTFLEFIILF